MPRKTDKRNRLIEAAKSLIHRQGFNLTTLADIAHLAEVPLGNVYYYFKTKDDIGRAVIDLLLSEFRKVMAKVNEERDPMSRLHALVESSNQELDSISQYGCPIGGLCLELGKKGGALADQVAQIMRERLDWSKEQFTTLGFTDSAEQYAVNLISGIQGGYLLAHTFKDPGLAIRQNRALMAWLDSLLVKTKAPARVVEKFVETETA